MSSSVTLAEKIGFIGAGQMAQALAAGWVQAKLVEAPNLVAADPMPAATAALQQRVPGLRVLNDNADVIAACSAVVLAVKPQLTAQVLSALPACKQPPLMISIVTGWTLARLNELYPARWIRVMPNTPCLVGESASAFAAGEGVTAAEKSLVQALLNGVGKAWELAEKQLDAVTGLSGSGPAYAYLMIEALSDGGVRMGLPREIATALAAQTLRGAGAMVLQTGEHPGLLKDRVASPGGTTIAGLYELETHGFRGALMAAVTAATRRSQELAAG